jgi:hypothetical protein
MKQLFSFCRNSVIGCLVFSGVASAQQKLNEVQVIGTHNSYKVAIDAAIMDSLRVVDKGRAERFEYSHVPIQDQLSLGLANLELDIAVDNAGGKYAHPAFYELFKEKYALPVFNQDGEMNKPGFKVLHVQDLDFRSHCSTLSQCLQILKKWSDENTGHHPVFITLNAKDNAVEGFPIIPDKFSPSDFKNLDELIVRELGEDKLITPDQVRGSYGTLEEAVVNKSWPELSSSLGRFIFILDETGAKREAYLSSESLKRVLFTNSPEGDANAAIMIINNPKRDFERIKELVAKGYIIRTRADADTYEARNGDFSRFKAAGESGAQIITTDYYEKSKHFKSDYFVQFPNGKYTRANPVLINK